MKLQQCMEIIRNESLDNLLDQEYLEKLLPTFGLDPSLSNHKLIPYELKSFCDTDIGFAQYPNQFSKYLIYLADKGIKNYLEIGVKFGGTFIITVEYLNRFYPIDRAVCLDIRPISKNLKEYKKFRNIEYLFMSSQDTKATDILIDGSFDLCLIDGDHSYTGCNSDYVKFKNIARYISFHDIVMMDGVVRTWQEAKKESIEVQEFIDQYDIPSPTYEGVIYDNCLGLGVVRRN